MPGNGVGDRVHNFFAQENLPQGLRSQDGNWTINDNLWVGNQKQFGVTDSSPRNYNSQESETERGHGGQRVADPHIFNITQTNSRPEFARNPPQSHHEQPNSNGYMYGRQNFQTRPEEANFMGVNTEYNQNNVNQRGFPFYEAQQESVPEQPPKNPFRPESSEAHGSFDLFGGQHQTNSQYPGLLQQPLQQQSGFGDIQQLQQQLMLRKMQELQRQHSSSNQASQFARQQASGSHPPGLVNGNPTSGSSGYGWTDPAAVNPNWLHRGASSSMHPEQGQPQRSMGFAQQQVEPSLYGVPVSSSRGSINQFHHNNSFPGNNYATVPEQSMVPGKGLFGNTFSQGSNSGMKMERIQQQVGPVRESPIEMVLDKSAADETSLDPEEEKILFGSDDNIWKAFGSSKNETGGVSSLLDDNEFGSGLPSMQSGSWSALMQSAVAETTSGDGSGGIGMQGEWPDLNSQNPVHSSAKQPYEDRGKHQAQTGLSGINLRNMNDTHHSMGFQNSTGGSNWLHRGGLRKADVEESRPYENSMPGLQTPPQHGTSQPNNIRNQFGTNKPFPPSVTTGFNMNANDNSSQHAQNNDWKRVNTAAIPNLSNLQQGGNHFNQFSPNNHHLNHWKHVDSSVKSKGSENSDISQHRLNSRGPQISESSFNSSDKEDLNSSRKENSNDSYRSSSSHLPNTVGQRETFSSDAGDSRSFAGTKNSLTNQSGRKISGPGPRKFQYHPMGNLDEDAGVPYGTRQSTNTKAVPLQHSRGLVGQDHGSFGATKASGQGFVPEVEGALKGSDDMRFKGMIPGHVPSIFAPHDRNVGLSTSDKASQSSQSQNMLELLHKVDQSRDGGTVRHLNSVERNLSSEIPEQENSDGSFGGHQRSQSSNSQGIGLQLGPPSQRLPMTMSVKHNSLSQSQPSANSIAKGQNLSAALGDTDFPNVRNQYQNHLTAGIESINGHVPQIRQTDGKSGEKSPLSHPRANYGVSQQAAFPKVSPNAWSNLQSQQLFAATQAHKSQLNIVESTSLGQQNTEEQKAEKIGDKRSMNAQGIITSVGEQSTEKLVHDQMMNGPAAGNNSTNTASQKDLEAFGHALKPNSFHQQISLLNQMKAYKHTDNDANNRVMKRLIDSDNILHSQQANVLLGKSEIPRSTVPTDSADRSLASQPAKPPSKDALAYDQNQIGPTSIKIENSHISPQMAPSWFDKYGTFKGGQMLSQRADAVRSVELTTTTQEPKDVPASCAVDNRQGSAIWKTPSVPSSVVVDHQLISPPLKTSTTVQNLVTVRPKKRKWSRDINSWLKEISGSSKNVQGICTASMEWCEATKRLMEKVEDDGELIGDVPRPKRRIILSTQLMQQLFPPPPSTLLSTDAISNYESVVFCASRLALGDACNLVSCVIHSQSNLYADKNTESEKIDDKRLLEAVEDCTSKEKRLENDFLRLDKRASLLDLRVEFQDVEKFSMINRFAKFHGRGQAEGEASSSDAVANAPKPSPQRYVIAVQMPKNLPDRVQCLSL